MVGMARLAGVQPRCPFIDGEYEAPLPGRLHQRGNCRPRGHHAPVSIVPCPLLGLSALLEAAQGELDVFGVGRRPIVDPGCHAG